jgi:uncharacterized protein (TIGR02246 family)
VEGALCGAPLSTSKREEQNRSRLRCRGVAVDPEDESAIRSLLARMADAWARGDAEAYAECFTEDSDYVTFNGIHLRGRAENREVHGPLFEGVLKGTRIDPLVTDLSFLSLDVALVHTASSARKKSLQTFVIVKRDGGWQIRAFQNTRIRAFSAWVTRRMARRGTGRA